MHVDADVQSDGSESAGNHSTRSCDLCSKDWLFILSTGGRTGSTTVLTMVNAIPGFELAGENSGAMEALFDLYNKANYTGFGDDIRQGMKAWWHENISRQEVLCSMQGYVETIMGDYDPGRTKVIGFKEIRHTKPATLEFFLKVFPCARFLWSTRATETLHESLWHQDETLSALDGVKASMQNFSNHHPERSFTISVENFTLPTFNQMLSWLGVSNCSYSHVAHYNYLGATEGGQPIDKEPKIDGSCTYVRPPATPSS